MILKPLPVLCWVAPVLPPSLELHPPSLELPSTTTTPSTSSSPLYSLERYSSDTRAIHRAVPSLPLVGPVPPGSVPWQALRPVRGCGTPS